MSVGAHLNCHQIQVDLGVEPPDWAEELVTEEAKADQNTPRGSIRFERDAIVFKPASTRPGVRPRKPEGWIYLSLAGHRTVGKRRLAAKQSIDSGKRLPQLKWLLEGVTVPASRRRTMNGLTPYALETFKGGKPTEKQALALDAALNTPDIAIIIGPPGTGKRRSSPHFSVALRRKPRIEILLHRFLSAVSSTMQ